MDPDRSSLRNEPSAKGMAFNSGLQLAPPILFLICKFGVASDPSKLCRSF